MLNSLAAFVPTYLAGRMLSPTTGSRTLLWDTNGLLTTVGATR